MEKEFVTYDQALTLNELGFKERVSHYFEDGEFKIHPTITGWDFNTSFTTCVSRPTKAQAFRWFRENYNWTIKVNQVSKNNWSYTLYNFPKDRTYYGEVYKTYEEAELECLNKLIEIVESKSE
jgi:hypothetical protein